MKYLSTVTLNNNVNNKMIHSSSKIFHSVAFYLFVMILFPLFSFAVDKPDYKKSRTMLVATLKSKYYGEAYSQNINNFYFKTCDSLIKRKVKIENQSIKNILAALFAVSADKLSQRDIYTLGIPSLNYSFLQVVKAYKKQPVNDLLMKINFTESNILAEVFSGFSISDSIRNIIGLKEMLYCSC